MVEIDARITGLRKPAYWAGILRRYGGQDPSRFFLVSVLEKEVQGYVVGEVRDWEFGSAPCGWVFGIGVRPETRLRRWAPGSWKRSAPRSAAAACRRCARCSRATTRWCSRSSAARG